MCQWRFGFLPSFTCNIIGTVDVGLVLDQFCEKVDHREWDRRFEHVHQPNVICFWKPNSSNDEVCRKRATVLNFKYWRKIVNLEGKDRPREYRWCFEAKYHKHPEAATLTTCLTVDGRHQATRRLGTSYNGGDFEADWHRRRDIISGQMISPAGEAIPPPISNWPNTIFIMPSEAFYIDFFDSEETVRSRASIDSVWSERQAFFVYNHAEEPEVHEVSNTMKRIQSHNSTTAECPSCKAPLVKSNETKEDRTTTKSGGSKGLVSSPGSNSFGIDSFKINNVGPDSLSGLYLPKSEFSAEDINGLAAGPFNVEGSDLYANSLGFHAPWSQSQGLNVNAASFNPMNGLTYPLNNFDPSLDSPHPTNEHTTDFPFCPYTDVNGNSIACAETGTSDNGGW